VNLSLRFSKIFSPTFLPLSFGGEFFFDGQWNALLTPFVYSLQHIGIVYDHELIDLKFHQPWSGKMSQTMP